MNGKWQSGSHLRSRSDPAPAVLPAHARAGDAARARPPTPWKASRPPRLDAHGPPARPAARPVVAAGARVRVPPARAASRPQTLPVNRQFIDGQDALVLDDAKAAPLLARLRGIGNPVDASPGRRSVDPRTVHVAVENGSGRTGLGARADDALGGLGYSVVGSATNADRSDYSVTEVRYAPGRGGQGPVPALRARRRGQGRRAERRARPAGADVVLVLGPRLQGPDPPDREGRRPRPRRRAATPPSGVGGAGARPPRRSRRWAAELPGRRRPAA